MFRIDSELSGVERGAIPCAYSTAENVLVRARVDRDDRALVVGASGGVGTAAVQLAKLRGAEVTTVASEEKAAALEALGADRVILRGIDLETALGRKSLTTNVRFDLRTPYLNDLSLYGCTAQEHIVGYLREGRIRPLIAATFLLAEIRRAQEMFLTKRFVGKIVLLP